LDPNLGFAYIERARVHAILGDKNSARADYQRAQQFGMQMQQYDQDLLNR